MPEAVVVEFPTPDHAAVASRVAEYASGIDGVDTVLVVNSCARAKAVPESDLDMAILMAGPCDETALEAAWHAHVRATPALSEFVDRSPFSAIHVDFFDGRFTPVSWDDGGGPDDFEVEIGNRIAYAVPLDAHGGKFDRLREVWLPYYPTELRDDRLGMVLDAALLDLEFIPFYVRRELFLQAFDRLYKAFREYLQGLFIAHRTYPLAYNKWLDEQLGWIDRRELLAPLLDILSVPDLKSNALLDRATVLREMVVELRGHQADSV